MKRKIAFLFFPILMGISSCMTHYQKFYQFNQNFEQGRLEDAEKVLANNKKAEKSKAKLLYYLNLGVVASIRGNYEISNNYLEQAYILADDYQTNYVNEAVSFLSNPNFVDYKGEDFELIYLHYYKALNFLKLGNLESSLVECRRMEIRLNQVSSKYSSESKFKKDAFIHLLMGVIYDASKDYNNAFIAYRNALEIYENDYKKFFNLLPPNQLIKDLIRVGYKVGFQAEARQYEKKYNIKNEIPNNELGELVFLWHNGLGPVKTEWGVNFVGQKGAGKQVIFNNAEFGWSFPFTLDSEEDYEKKGLASLQIVRVVFPKYQERPTIFQQASLTAGSTVFPLEKAEDLNAISFKSLEQRMLWELSKSLLRVALKKGAEFAVRKDNEELGAAIGILNSITEKADTRNWQTLPSAIYITRISLPVGKQNVTLELSGNGSSQKHEISFDIRKGQTLVHSFHSLEHKPIPGHYAY